MKLTKRDHTRIQKDIIPQITKHYAKTGQAVALNELPFWKPLSKSQKIKIGRRFKKVVMDGDIQTVKFAGQRADNHSTYKPAGAGGGGLSGFFGKLFG